MGQKQAARSGDGDGHGLVRIGRGGLAQHLHDGGAHVGVMAAVHRPQDLVVVVRAPPASPWSTPRRCRCGRGTPPRRHGRRRRSRRRRREPSSTVVTRGAQEAHAAGAGSFADVDASVMISVYLPFLAFFFIGLLPTLQLDGLAGLDRTEGAWRCAPWSRRIRGSRARSSGR